MAREGRQCVICEAEMVEHSATPTAPFRFTDSGLNGVYLAGIKYYVCANGHTFANIPAIEELMSLIARDVTRKQDSLSGDEIRFLRKRLGEKSTVFAQAISVKPESLSRIENGHAPAGQRVDRLVRYHYSLQSQDSVLIADIASAMKSLMLSKKPPSSARIDARVTPNNHWQTKIAA